MIAYWSFFKIRFLTKIQYRAAAIAGVITQLSWGFMYIMIYNSFYKSNPSAVPMDISQLTSYIWLQQAFLAFFMMWVLDNEIFEQISSGNVAYEMSRPLDLYNMWFTKNAANRIAMTLLRCIPIMIVASFLPGIYKLKGPDNLEGFILFIISMIVAFIVVIAYSMLIYIFTFYTISDIGVKMVMVMISDFLSGSIIPLPLLPDKIAKVLYLLPFSSMQNTPFRIYAGTLSNAEAIKYIVLQIFWAGILIIIGKVLMKISVKKIIVQGG